MKLIGRTVVRKFGERETEKKIWRSKRNQALPISRQKWNNDIKTRCYLERNGISETRLTLKDKLSNLSGVIEEWKQQSR